MPTQPSPPSSDDNHHHRHGGRAFLWLIALAILAGALVIAIN